MPYLSQAVYKAQRKARMGPSVAHDLPAIQQRDTLTVIAPYNSTTYFLYRAEPMGYEYELLRKFAEDMDVTLRMLVVTERDSMVKLLRAGKGDIVAARMVPTPEDSGLVAYTKALYTTNPVLVQRAANPPAPAPTDTTAKPDSAAQPAQPARPATTPVTTARVRQIQRPSQLQGQRVDVPEQSPYTRTLIELADTLTGDIHVVEVDASSEALIRAVSEGTIRFTVAQGNLADISSEHYTNLSVRPVLGEAGPIAWAVRPNAPQLLTQLDQWIADQKNAPLLKSLYTKYFIHSAGYHQRIDSPFLASTTGRLSEYDTLFKEGAKKIGWDWRLLASQAYQESKFKPRARSWADVSYWLLQKSKKEVYTNPVVRYGYSRGIEPVNYVAIILERFNHYRQTGDE